ncbi:MAG: hypothetical protein HQL69_09805 [Magnetococcales bacterium]|nr:hypothetical protein [Magnetococcales bacterium]
MNKKMLVATILSITLASPIWAADKVSPDAFKEDRIYCEMYATQDKVSQDKMAKYLASCLQEIQDFIAEIKELDRAHDNGITVLEEDEELVFVKKKVSGGGSYK